VTDPPPFDSFRDFRDYRARLGDVEFWSPYVTAIRARHGLMDSGADIVAGFNPTYPTFVCGDIVVKFFGFFAPASEDHVAEHGANVLLATDADIAAPRVLAAGNLFDDVTAPWPYLVTTRMRGQSCWHAQPTPEAKRVVVDAVGRQVRRVHALRPSGVATDADWPPLDFTRGAEQSSLPPHLVAQAADYVTRLSEFDRVFVHGDLCDMHVFVDDDAFTGIIDWGASVVTDRHYEIIQVFRDLCACDKTLFHDFLDASDWPVRDDFPRQALGLALYRQAVGTAQHGRIDVFMPVAAAFPLDDIATLDELADALFGLD
jgi:hygromycin-B 7''-O-kinase